MPNPACVTAPSMQAFADYILHGNATNDAALATVQDRFAQLFQTNDALAAIAQTLWTGSPSLLRQLRPLRRTRSGHCAGCGRDTYPTTLASYSSKQYFCYDCEDTYNRFLASCAAIPERTITITTLTLNPTDPQRCPLDPPGSRQITFDPPLRLTIIVGTPGEPGCYLTAFEEPREPVQIQLTDVNGELGLTITDPKELADNIATTWGDEFLSTLSQAQGHSGFGAEPIHPDDQRAAQERLAYWLSVRITALPATAK